MRLQLAFFVLFFPLFSCNALVTYSDQLVDEGTGRSAFVTKPAALGGIVGFIVGIPVDVVALPVSYFVYLSQKEEDEEGLDSLSTLLFPSFLLWRAGVLLVGTPLDLVEFSFYRFWVNPNAKSSKSNSNSNLDDKKLKVNNSKY